MLSSIGMCVAYIISDLIITSLKLNALQSLSFKCLFQVQFTYTFHNCSCFVKCIYNSMLTNYVNCLCMVALWVRVCVSYVRVFVRVLCFFVR